MLPAVSHSHPEKNRSFSRPRRGTKGGKWGENKGRRRDVLPAEELTVRTNESHQRQMNKGRGVGGARKKEEEVEKEQQLEEETEDEGLVLWCLMFDTDADGGVAEPIISGATCWAAGRAGSGDKKFKAHPSTLYRGKLSGRSRGWRPRRV